MIHVDLPAAPVAAEIEWEPHQPSQTNESEFTGTDRTVILAQAPFWTAKVTYPTIIGEARFRPWRSALMRLQGRANAFRLVAVEGPQHGEHQAVVIDGVGQTGFALATRGWQPGTGLNDGMMVTVGDQLLQLVADTGLAGADGKLTLKVLPHIPAGLVDGGPVETRLPWALMRMTTDAPGWKVGRGQQYAITFECRSVR